LVYLLNPFVHRQRCSSVMGMGEAEGTGARPRRAVHSPSKTGV